ncbi:PAS domain S-box protein [Thiorhodococcus drewsii]|uniref:PAS domain S-box protein n=1 Tax=Thiorhodococcus drewsii TaxID=210408 RepID=UPI00131F319D|nr:PAS domain S-box protein [Thiorhodococcus drewsii]
MPIVVLLSIGVCVLLFWQHWEHRLAMQRVVQGLAEMRQAQIDLAKGFLQVSLSGSPGAPFSRDAGIVLLHQSIDSFERALAARGSASTDSLESFERAASEFEHLLDRWRLDPSPDPSRMVALRVAYGDLERRAEESDAAVEQGMVALNGLIERNFVVTLTGAVLALMITIGIVILAVRRQHLWLQARQQSDAALRESESNLREAKRLARLGHWHWSLDRKHPVWSEEIYEICGLDPTSPAPRLVELRHLFDPESWGVLSEALRRVRVEGVACECDLRILCHDGDQRWATMRGEALRNGSGEVVALRGTLQDVTFRKQAELALAEQTLHYEAMIATSIDGFWMLDPEGRILATNDAYLKRSGYGREEMLGMRVADLEAMETSEHVAPRIARIKRSGHDLFESRHRTKDGVVWPVEVSVSFSPASGGRLFVFIRDIGERKRANRVLFEQQTAALEEQRRAQIAALSLMEEAIAARERAETAFASLRESEQRLLLAQEGAQVGIWEWDPAEDRLYCSPECHRLYGLPPDSFSRIDDWGACLHPEDFKRLRSGWLANPDASPFFEDEFRIFREHGEVRWIFTKGHLVRDASGLPRLFGINMDVTDQKHLVAELEQYRLHLEELVEVRTSELAAARNEAERLARIKSAFLANMSHEIRTPLNAVLGLARIGARDSLGLKVRSTFERILMAGEHLLGVINDILDYSKIEAGRFVLESHAFRLVDLISKAADLQVGVARDKGLDYRIECSPDLPGWVMGDAQRLRQILVNLLSNAVKFTERGEVCLRVEVAGPCIRFNVTDTGVGMRDEQIARLFTPFEQADGSTTRRFGGTGLGLAISRNLARLMGGEILVESAPGQGSRFTLSLSLPIAEPVQDRTKFESEMAGRRLAGIHVLAAEDVELNRVILEDLLEHEGARCRLVENGRLAVESVRKAGPQGFDLVLMDVQMPEMDGYEATRRIHALAPDLPVIALTAHALPEERAKCMSAGMVDHVSKPIEPDALVAAILGHVARTQPDRAIEQEDAGMPDSEAGCVLDSGRACVDWDRLTRRFEGRPGFVEKLIRVSLSVTVESPGRLRAAIASGNLGEIDFVAHSIKGTAANLEAARIVEQAALTERSAKAGQEAAFAQAAELADMVESLEIELRRMLDR